MCTGSDEMEIGGSWKCLMSHAKNGKRCHIVVIRCVERRLHAVEHYL
jgi:hypothetical protein